MVQLHRPNRKPREQEETVKMAKQTFSIPNISCGHCVMSIKNELSELAGVKTVEGSPEQKTVTVEWDAPVTEEKIKATLKDINYPAA
jgi:copper chaperone CopZ